jgi:hypothetical protein
VIVLVTAALVTLLWLTLAVDPADPARAGTQLEVLRIGTTVALGGGGGIALFLAWRRQRSTEIGLLRKERDQADVARAYELQRESFEITRVHQERVAAATERDAFLGDCRGPATDIAQRVILNRYALGPLACTAIASPDGDQAIFIGCRSRRIIATGPPTATATTKTKSRQPFAHAPRGITTRTAPALVHVRGATAA